MFVGTVVCGLLIQSCSGIACRFALLRDVSMYALSVGVVWYTLESGTVTARDAKLFIGIYLAYVTLVLLSDLYHRKVTLHRLHLEGQKRRQSLIERARRLSQISEKSQEHEDAVDESTPLMIRQLKDNGAVKGEESDIDDAEIAYIQTTFDSSSSLDNITTPSGQQIPRKSQLWVSDRFAMLMSNYDPRSVKFDKFDRLSTCESCDSSELEAITTVGRVLSAHLRPEAVPPTSLDEVEGQHERIRPHLEVFSEEPEPPVMRERTWCRDLFIDAYDELVFSYHHFLRNGFQNETSPLLEKLGLFIELPFVAARTVSCIHSIYCIMS